MKNSNKVPICGVTYIDEKKVKRVEKEFPDEEAVLTVSETLKILGDPTRLKIVLSLAKEELCVCDLSVIAGVSISAVSHHLRLLRAQRLVKFRKSGKIVYYSLADEHMHLIVNLTLEHAAELRR